MSKPDQVPESVEYRRCAVQQRTVEGAVPLAKLSRLRSAVYCMPEAGANAQLQLEFAEDAQRRVRVSGRATAHVMLQCQRCMSPFEHVVDAAVAGVIVADEASAANVPTADEPIMADGDMLDVYALAEDELLLALPMVARCNRSDCQTRYNVDDNVAKSAAPAHGQGKDNPFSVLENIKHDHETD